MLPNERLIKTVNQFIRSPYPLWEIELTDQLVQAFYAKHNAGIADRLSYHTVSAWLGEKSDEQKQFLTSYGERAIYVERPNFEALSNFYSEHGLVPLTARELIKKRAATKLKNGLSILAAIPDCIYCIASLVNCMQVIWSDGPEYDTSYSHPNIPFTIFVSICEKDTSVSDMRVAEGILHEAMHLKLTLIEHLSPFIETDVAATFYSPWREEHRPLRGVIHGLFVFRAIRDFYHECLPNAQTAAMKKFMNSRLKEIDSELLLLQEFPNANGLTISGKALALRLLEIKRS